MIKFQFLLYDGGQVMRLCLQQVELIGLWDKCI